MQCGIYRRVPVSGQLAASAGSVDASAGRERARNFGRRASTIAIPILSVAAFLGLWELISRTGTIDQSFLPPMTTTVNELWSMVTTNTTKATFFAGDTTSFWGAFARTVRGWGLGLLIATVLAVPLGILLGTSEYLERAVRVPVEFLRPIPSAVLIPVLLIATPAFGVSLRSELFLAAYGAFWPLLIQTIYGVKDVDPVAIDTARSFGIGKRERLYRVTLPSTLPYVATGFRIASQVALILAFTAELFGVGTKGLGAKETFAQSYSLESQVYAIALATGILGVTIHLLTSAAEKRVLRWHPSQRGTT